MKKVRNKKGVTVLETALMIGFIYVLLGLIFSGGQLINNKMALNSAAYRAARMAVVKPNVNEAKVVAEQYVKDILKSSGLSIENVSVTVAPKNGVWKKGNTATISVTGYTKTLFPIPDMQNPIYAGTKTKMQSNVVMMIEKE